MTAVIKKLLKPDTRRLILALLLLAVSALVFDPLYLFLVINIIIWYVFASVLVFAYDRTRKKISKTAKKPVKKTAKKTAKRRGKRR